LQFLECKHILAFVNASMRLPMDEDDEITGRAKGGVARAEALSPSRRAEIARRAASVRWGKLEALRDGVLKIGGHEIQCFVLDDETHTRILARAAFVRAIGRTGKVKGGRRFDDELQTPAFLSADNLKPFWPSDLEVNSKPIIFTHKGVGIIGYRAELLPDVCDIFQDAKNAKALRPNQRHIADACRMLSRGLTRLGVIGLVDEATGYQEVRDREALQAILDKFLRKELAAWAKRFPDEFYKEMFRLRGWDWMSISGKRPRHVGNLTNDLIYDRLAPGILAELETRNPKDEYGRRRRKHHQWLTEDVGHPALAQHLHAVTGFMRASSTWDQFYRLMNRAFPKRGNTLELPLDD
jgi:hypothetical protein